MKTNGLPKRERLKSKKMIQELFAKGSSLFLYPFKIAYLMPSSAADVGKLPQILVSVSRRNFRRAHDRNLIKRRCREIYRVYKSELLARKRQLPAYLGIIYVGKKHETFAFMQQQLREVLDRLPAATPASEIEPPTQTAP
ncbi:ribonuclease P protein component [Rhodoflexus caldus]|uniref:ribonuclease P protein component n=1 Tax=Rhodoflexus caldus TaxID=2891236 RepID=UPI0021D45F83|nr:ribonuclease P protein component [Rhodoflexus caldus]